MRAHFKGLRCIASRLQEVSTSTACGRAQRLLCTCHAVGGRHHRPQGIQECLGVGRRAICSRLLAMSARVAFQHVMCLFKQPDGSTWTQSDASAALPGPRSLPFPKWHPLTYL